MIAYELNDAYFYITTMDDFKNILIIRLDRIGDVLLSTPVFKTVREAYPKSHISVMVRPYAEDVVLGNPYIDDLIVYDKDGAHKGALATLVFCQRLRARRFDCAIVLHPSNRSHIVPFLAGIPMRLGYDRKLSFLLTKSVPHKKEFGLKHEIDYALDVVHYIGIEPTSHDLYMPIKESSEARIDELFKKHALAHGAVVVTLHPGASCPSKRWPPERFADVADKLAQKYGARIVVIAGPKEKGFGDRVCELIKSKTVNVSGTTSVADVASILKRSRLLVSNDSGPVHIACAIGTPVVALFGRSDRGLSPVRWGPSGKRSIILHKYIGCDVCRAHKCEKGFECLNAITVDEVLSACDSFLRTTQ